MRILIRTLESAVYPIGFVWICLTISALVLYRKQQRGAAFLCALLSVVLYISGSTPLPEYLIARLEKPFANATANNAQPADAVLVLGGFINPSAHDSFGFSVTSAADRWITGVELMRQKKARVLVISGGPAKFDGQLSSEGIRMEKFLKTWNVAPGEIIGLDACQDTRQEAERMLALAARHKWTNIILVTSAFHMARAQATMQKAGLKVSPVACDFEGLPTMEGEGLGFRLVPIVDHVKTLTLYLHEVIGWYYYMARGWV